MLFNKFVLVTIALCAFAAPLAHAYATKCYECSKCPDPFDKKDGEVKVKDCGAGNHFCLKIFEKDSEGGKILIKTCINAKNYEEMQEQRAKGSRTYAELIESVCDSDLCNSSPNAFGISLMQKLFIFAASFVSIYIFTSMKQ